MFNIIKCNNEKKIKEEPFGKLEKSVKQSERVRKNKRK